MSIIEPKIDVLLDMDALGCAVAVPAVGDGDVMGSDSAAQAVSARAQTSSAAACSRVRFTFSSPPRGYCARRQPASRREFFQKFTPFGLAACKKAGIIEKNGGFIFLSGAGNLFAPAARLIK